MGQNESTTPQAQSTTTSESSPTSLKPPDDPPEKIHIHKQDQHVLILEGRVFTRYCIKKGVPCRSDVLVSYNKDTKSICWSSPDTIKYDPLHSMKIKDISKILYGKQTAAFQTPLAASAPSSFCFSIVSNKLHKSIDLEASEAERAVEFASALDHMLEQSKLARARWSLPNPPYQMPITQPCLSRALNASLIQYNKKALKSKDNVRTGVRTSKSKKGKVRVSGDLQRSQSIRKSSNPPSHGNRPKVGSKRKTKCSPVIEASRVVLSDLPR